MIETVEVPIRLMQFSKGAGCGCKIAPSVLQQIISGENAEQSENNEFFKNLLVGNESNDDAAIYELDEHTAIISTTDFFLPIVDDAFDFGRIAAANAISDVYAMGGTPIMAIAILGWPIDKIPAEVAQQVLEGGRAICKEANIPLAGGHTIDSNDPIFGLAVTGTVDKKHIKTNNTAQEGDLLFLTKPIGSGILSTALKRELLQTEHYKPFAEQMTSLNKVGVELGKINSVHAMTDITGFGLLGHLIEMTEASNVSVELYYNHIKRMQGVEDYLIQRIVPDATFRNWNSYSNKVQFDKGVNVMEAFNLLPDPQTNGGLLISVKEEGIEEVKKLFSHSGLDEFLEPVGRCIDKKEKTVYVTTF